MDIGLIGLGRMGGNIAIRLSRDGHRVVGFDQDPSAVKASIDLGIDGVSSIQDLIVNIPRPRVLWVMLPAGDPTEEVVQDLIPMLSSGDILVDGGNCHYLDSMRRASLAKVNGVEYMDVGISGGIKGLSRGYSVMVGGSNDAFDSIEPILRSLAAEGTAYGWIGPSGSGHYAKMVHNGIEYGLMQAYAEGFELLFSKKEFDIDLGALSGIWQHGSVISSTLLDFINEVLDQDSGLDNIVGYVEDTGGGRWTVSESIAMNVPIPVITAALQQRFRSRLENSYGDRLQAALRHAFGGHSVITN